MIVDLSPSDYVNQLMDLRIPGYQGYPGGQVSLTAYLCANGSFGGNKNASQLYALMKKITRGKEEASLMLDPEFPRVFTGQGSISQFINAMTVVNRLKGEFQKEPSLAKYFQQQDFLQAMVDDKCFGQDCIGFVGTYLAEAGVLPAYPGLYPIDYTRHFTPIKSFSELHDWEPAVVMKADGQHIQMIDWVADRQGSAIKVWLCQSSGGKPPHVNGPQANYPVTIRSGGGDYLDIAKFRAAKGQNAFADDWRADDAERTGRGEKARGYEGFLRAKFTTKNTQFGYMGGAIYNILGDGKDQPNPVAGSVYIGVLKGTSGLQIRERIGWI